MKCVWLADDVYAEIMRLSSLRGMNRFLRKKLDIPDHQEKKTRRKKSEAIRLGVERARKRGKIIGRPRFPESLRGKIRRNSNRLTRSQIAELYGISEATVKRIWRGE